MAGISHSKAVVLVVEDDCTLRKVVIRIIEAAGFDVMEAAYADKAMGKLERQASIHIIFTDFDMPGSMDGLKLANAVRKRWPPMSIIIASGRRRSRDHQLPTHGVFMTKP